MEANPTHKIVSFIPIFPFSKSLKTQIAIKKRTPVTVHILGENIRVSCIDENTLLNYQTLKLNRESIQANFSPKNRSNLKKETKNTHIPELYLFSSLRVDEHCEVYSINHRPTKTLKH